MKKMWLAGVAGALALSSTCVLGQGRPGGMMGGPGGPPGGGMGGRMRMRMPMALNRAPVEALKGPLKLNDGQVKKLDTIQSKFRDDAMGLFRQGMGGGPGMGGGRTGMGGPGMGGPGMGGGRPGMGGPGAGGAEMQKNMDKIQGMAKKASADMNAVLTPAQRTKVPALLAAMDAAQGAGIPLGAVGDLNLTPDQVKKLKAVGDASREKQMKAFQGMGPGGDRDAMMKKFTAMRDEQRKATSAVLNPAQRAAVAAYEKAHPRRGFGGPGGPGGGPGGPGGPRMGGPGMGGPGGPGGPRMGGPGGGRGR
ncbi:MAG: hypothetical protein NT029_13385 [Armatimonadetes bacterium]|nr:hypothetical protein [Armatimonadota bacterium]